MIETPMRVSNNKFPYMLYVIFPLSRHIILQCNFTTSVPVYSHTGRRQDDVPICIIIIRPAEFDEANVDTGSKHGFLYLGYNKLWPAHYDGYPKCLCTLTCVRIV